MMMLVMMGRGKLGWKFFGENRIAYGRAKHQIKLFSSLFTIQNSNHLADAARPGKRRELPVLGNLKREETQRHNCVCAGRAIREREGEQAG